MVWSSVTVFCSVTNFGRIRPSSGLIFFPSPLSPPPQWRDNPPSGRGLAHYRCFTNTFRHTTLGRTPLDEWSARRRDLYLTTHNTHNRQTCPRRDSNPQSLQASGRPQTNTDGAVTGTGSGYKYGIRNDVEVRCNIVFLWAATGFPPLFTIKCQLASVDGS